MATIPYVIDYQGDVHVEYVHVHTQSKNILCLHIGTKEKRVDVTGTGYYGDDGPCIDIDLQENPDLMTLLRFPEHTGWEVFSSGSVGRYLLAVVLVREKLL